MGQMAIQGVIYNKVTGGWLSREALCWDQGSQTRPRLSSGALEREFQDPGL